jgi:hypothetical protein
LLSRWWLQRPNSLIIVEPETVLRWRREGWAALWQYRSRGRSRGARFPADRRDNRGGLESTGDPIFNNPWSMTGNPPVSLPSGLRESGLPLAIQLVGSSFAEGSLLAIAQWCGSLLAFSHMPQIVRG